MEHTQVVAREGLPLQKSRCNYSLRSIERSTQQPNPWARESSPSREEIIGTCRKTIVVNDDNRLLEKKQIGQSNGLVSVSAFAANHKETAMLEIIGEPELIIVGRSSIKAKHAFVGTKRSRTRNISLALSQSVGVGCFLGIGNLGV